MTVGRQMPTFDQRREHTFTASRVYVEEPRGLFQCELQARHFLELRVNARAQFLFLSAGHDAMRVRDRI